MLVLFKQEKFYQSPWQSLGHQMWGGAQRVAGTHSCVLGVLLGWGVV